MTRTEKDKAESARIRENLSRRYLNFAAYDAMPDMESIKLKRILLPKDRKTSKSDLISKDKIYLAASDGKWALGYFREVWYGWVFYWFDWSTCQLDSLDFLYETDLKRYERPHPYIKPPDEDEDEDE